MKKAWVQVDGKEPAQLDLIDAGRQRDAIPVIDEALILCAVKTHCQFCHGLTTDDRRGKRARNDATNR